MNLSSNLTSPYDIWEMDPTANMALLSPPQHVMFEAQIDLAKVLGHTLSHPP